MFANIDWGETFAVVIMGMGVVFAVLIILVLLCWVFGKVFTGINNKAPEDKLTKEQKAEAKAKKALEKAQSKLALSTVKPEVESGIGDDIIAAISGAISCILGGNAKFALKSVKRSRSTRSSWNAAGIADNTRPF